MVFRIKSMQPRAWKHGRAVAPGGQGLDEGYVQDNSFVNVPAHGTQG